MVSIILQTDCIRLTPVYAVILGFNATLLADIGASPNWQNVRYVSEGCRWNWWCHLLYVNNYVLAKPDLGGRFIIVYVLFSISLSILHPHPLQCMSETWYLACDMQMFLVSPLFIYLLWRWRKIGIAWSFVNILAYIGGTIAIYIIWNLPAIKLSFFSRACDLKLNFMCEFCVMALIDLALINSGINDVNYSIKYYIQTWTRAPPYILGILLGWLVHTTKNKQIKFNKVYFMVHNQ